MTYNIFQEDVEIDEAAAFCDPEKPKDYCHFENIVYDGMPMSQMEFAHTYFLVINWV
jgi:hypothetical protein